MLATQVCADEIQYKMIFNLNDTQTVKSVAHKVTLAGCDCSISFPLLITGRFPPPVPYLSDKKRFCVFTTSKAVREMGGGLELLTDLTTPDYMMCGKGVRRNRNRVLVLTVGPSTPTLKKQHYYRRFEAT